jgi:1-deoxy-D-xylulose-5-phosphate synthase
MFEDLGMKYVGPIYGHDINAVEDALRKAKDFGQPVIVHCVTRKGFGYAPAEADDADCMHGVSVIDPVTGLPLAVSTPSWTDAFSAEIVALGAERPDLVAITAAMLQPVGLQPFADAFPDRVFDVGIAEQHAVTSAAGLAMGGLHPVVCVYATFLNRAFDQVLMDVALHKLGVTFVLDRAGVTGEDGASHNGMWDLSWLPLVPGVRVAAPRDASTLRAALREAVTVDDAPTVVRFPKGPVPDDMAAVDRVGGVDVLRRSESTDVLLVAVGAMASTCLDAAERIAAAGVGVTVVDPRWVVPVDPSLVALAAAHDLVVTVEDGGRTGGIGSLIAQTLREASVDVPLRTFGIPAKFLEHGKRHQVLADLGLTAADIARDVLATIRQDAQKPLPAGDALP